MIDEEKVCCMCDQHKKFLARMNAGKKLYCMQCKAKIIKEHGMNYWKPCSQVEFFESMLSNMRKGSNKKPNNMFSSMKEVVRQFDKEEENNNEKFHVFTPKNFFIFKPICEKSRSFFIANLKNSNIPKTSSCSTKATV